MKILVISSYQDTKNAVRPEGALLIGLHRRGHAVTVMTQGDAPYAAEFRAAGMKVIDFHPTQKFASAAVVRIRTELLAGAYDILHLYNNKAIINGIRAARGLPVKVVTYRGYTGNIHWWDPTSYLTHLHPRVDLITCVSPAVKAVFDRQLFFNSQKAVVVSKGHQPAWYQPIVAADLRTEFNIPTDAIVATIVANARRMKGIPYLLEAISALPPTLPLHFLFIGRGLDDARTLRRIQQTAYADRIHFSGFRTDVLSLVKAGDFSILPSVKGEGLSKVLLEALFLGKATLMTDIAGNRGLARHQQTALVVPPRDPQALATAIEQLATDAPLRQRLGQAAQTYVAKHYHTERSVDELIAAYQSLFT